MVDAQEHLIYLLKTAVLRMLKVWNCTCVCNLDWEIHKWWVERPKIKIVNLKDENMIFFSWVKKNEAEKKNYLLECSYKQ